MRLEPRLRRWSVGHIRTSVNDFVFIAVLSLIGYLSYSIINKKKLFGFHFPSYYYSSSLQCLTLKTATTTVVAEATPQFLNQSNLPVWSSAKSHCICSHIFFAWPAWPCCSSSLWVFPLHGQDAKNAGVRRLQPSQEYRRETGRR